MTEATTVLLIVAVAILASAEIVAAAWLWDALRSRGRDY